MTFHRSQSKIRIRKRSGHALSFLASGGLMLVAGCNHREVEFIIKGIDESILSISIGGTLKSTHRSNLEEVMVNGDAEMRVGVDFDATFEALSDGESANFAYIVEGLRADKCAVASKEGTVTIRRDHVVEVEVELLREAKPLCRVSLELTGIGKGTVSSSPTGISCGETCSQRFVAGQRIMLTAENGPTSHFSGWSGDCSTNRPVCVIDSISRPYRVEAHYNRGVCTAQEWCWENPLPQGNRLAGLWGATGPGGTVWAVGAGGTVLERLPDGSGWLSHIPGVQGDLNGISGASANDLWMVGSSGLILHWDGKAFQRDTTAMTTVALASVSAVRPTEAWTVGANGTILQMLNGVWQPKASNDINMNSLYRVVSYSPSSVFAVGTRGVVQQWDGTSWQPKPYTMGTARELYSLFGVAANQQWAVGERGVIVFFDGTSWTNQDTVATGTTNLFSVWGVDAKRLWAVGQGTTILQAQDGRQWVPIDRSKLPTGLSATLYDVWGNGQRVWTVGDNGTILTSGDGQTWGYDDALLDPKQPGSTSPNEIIYAIASNDARTAWAVGERGLILFWDGERWQKESNPDETNPQSTLRAVFASGGQIWAVGDRGTVLKRTTADADGIWQTASLQTPDQLNAVAVNGTHVFVAGTAGALWRRPLALSSPWQDRKYALEDLNAILIQDNQVYVAGKYGTFASNIHLSNTATDEANRMWMPQNTSSMATIYSMSGVSNGDLWAVGDTVVLRRRAGVWSQATTVPGETLFGVASNAEGAWVIGSRGTALRYKEGGTFSSVPTSSLLRLRGISLAGAEQVLVVGENGSILRYSPR